MESSASLDPFEDGGDTFATFTSSALDAIATAINETWDQWGDEGGWDGASGDTIMDPIAGESSSEGSYILVRA